MDTSNRYKICPRCNTRAYLTAPKCDTCGRQYRTVHAEEATKIVPPHAPTVAPPQPQTVSPSTAQPYTGGIDGPAVSLILGCAGIGAFLLPFIGMPLSIAAILTSARVLSTAGRRRGIATAGLITGIVGSVLGGINIGAASLQSRERQPLPLFTTATPPPPDGTRPQFRNAAPNETAPVLPDPYGEQRNRSARRVRLE